MNINKYILLWWLSLFALTISCIMVLFFPCLFWVAVEAVCAICWIYFTNKLTF